MNSELESDHWITNAPQKRQNQVTNSMSEKQKKKTVWSLKSTASTATIGPDMKNCVQQIQNFLLTELTYSAACSGFSVYHSYGSQQKRSRVHENSKLRRQSGSQGENGRKREKESVHRLLQKVTLGRFIRSFLEPWIICHWLRQFRGHGCKRSKRAPRLLAQKSTIHRWEFNSNSKYWGRRSTRRNKISKSSRWAFCVNTVEQNLTESQSPLSWPTNSNVPPKCSLITNQRKGYSNDNIFPIEEFLSLI